MKNKIINIAVIAHVDAGKSTLVDAFLQQSGVFRENQAVAEQIMDSNDLERERGITIYSKNCSVMHNGIKINIVDTPGHADFSSEVERIMKTVDTVILLVDSIEGPMPQTRFVLQKSLEIGLRPILLINKIDKKNHRAEEVVDMVFDLFVELNANDEQLDFPILYGIAKQGIVQYELDEESDSIIPLFDTIIKHVQPYPDRDDENLQLQVSTLGYDDYIGRLGIGRVTAGTIKEGQIVSVAKHDGSVEKQKISNIFIYEGLKRTQIKEAFSGDIVVLSGIYNISIGDTICSENNVIPMETIKIEEPTLSMNFLINTSPFSGLSGKYVTTRHLKARLEKELEVNVGLKVEALEGALDGYKVSGRGELHLSILLENMRREGYEVAVSRPEVILKKMDGVIMEPVERVIVNVPEIYSGSVISKLNLRKGIMVSMMPDGNYVKIEYMVPTRGLLGYRTELINDSRGEGTIVRIFDHYEKFKGEIPQRTNGVLISNDEGEAIAYSLNNLESRGTLFVAPGEKIYEGMIIGVNSRGEDITVNPCKLKKQSNVRSSSADDAIKLSPPRIMTLETALEFINDDELVEITPDAIRLRKRYLTEMERRKHGKRP
ncbi:MAG: translational GTPase TypA [Tissierellia bacterium]|jgi:GTP-binding protein|nr:translational GTPase TypA [Tissierellia bacterium]MDD3227142.1 translational GTPase TypA [Tissierellia bacterium]MDD3751361.1 translational GTPase TypA [Tissierellia bacterium]MDD4046546.1 translational GTPase TypA [Tissierellia bacterium]MDD4678179.1 translational GTPase TypA [Tissierellia bacterium]